MRWCSVIAPREGAQPSARSTSVPSTSTRLALGRLALHRIALAGALWLITALVASSYAEADDAMPAANSPLTVLSQLLADPGVTVRHGISYGPKARHKLDVYEPAEPAKPRGPIVVFYYGGSWQSGERGIYAFLGSALASRGYTTVIADYRLYPEVRFPAFVEDAALAYGWVARSLAGSRGEMRPIYVMGHSAGAHIAALLTLDPRYLCHDRARRCTLPRPAGFIGLSGPYAFDPTTYAGIAPIFAPTAGNPEQARPVAVAQRSTVNPPPALLLHGGADRTVTPEATLALTEALRRAGGQVRAITYPGVGHIGLVLAYAAPLRWRASALEATIAFIDGSAR